MSEEPSDWDIIEAALKALKDVQFEPDYGAVPDPLDCLAALSRLRTQHEREQAVIEAAREARKPIPRAEWEAMRATDPSTWPTEGLWEALDAALEAAALTPPEPTDLSGPST